MNRIVWKFSFCSLRFQWWFKFLEKSVHLPQKCHFHKQSWTFFRVKWPTSNMQNSAYRTSTQLAWFIFLLNFIEMLWSYKKCQKIGAGMGLGWVRTKNVLAKTIPDKIFGTKWNNPVKLDRRRKVWCLFLRVIQLLLVKSKFLKEDEALGHELLNILKLRIFQN